MTRRLAGALVLTLAIGCGPGDRPRPDQPAPVAIAPDLENARREFASGLDGSERRDLAAFYEREPDRPAWLDAAGRPDARAEAGLALLEGAAADGLDPADYRAAELRAQASSLAGRPTAGAAARFDVALGASLLRYLRHLHLGRVDPRSIGLRLSAPDDGHDFAAILRSARDEGRLAEVAREVAPPLSQYRALGEALERYRALAAADTTQAELPGVSPTVHPGDHLPGAAAVHRRLVALGDLPANAPPPASARLDDATLAGIVRFQERHGLEADGVIGPATWRALRVPLSWRVRQIEMALERLRWLPDLRSGRTIAVNIPMYRLWAWDEQASDAAPALTMPVIVGRALDTRTPVLAESLEHVIFRPYWNVPASILRGEMLPILRRDPDYLERENLEIVAGPGDSAAILPATPENIARLGSGGVRLRQRPGPGNALGLVKFVFPNDDDVYMHDTPAPDLFRRARRDLSHGCIRLADPVALAEWVLKADAAWTRERIVGAMNGSDTRRVDLARPIQVIIVYTTAVVSPEDGRLHFAEDVYGQDVVLDEALGTPLPGADAPGVDVHEVR